jgi:hypothetical protein
MEHKKILKKKKICIEIYYWSWIICTASMSALIASATYYQMEAYFVNNNRVVFLKQVKRVQKVG